MCDLYGCAFHFFRALINYLLAPDFIVFSFKTFAPTGVGRRVISGIQIQVGSLTLRASKKLLKPTDSLSGFMGVTAVFLGVSYYPFLFGTGGSFC